MRLTVPYTRPSKIGCTLQNSGRLLTPEQQNLDVSSTCSGPKYDHLNVIQNPAVITVYITTLDILQWLLQTTVIEVIGCYYCNT